MAKKKVAPRAGRFTACGRREHQPFARQGSIGVDAWHLGAEPVEAVSIDQIRLVASKGDNEAALATALSRVLLRAFLQRGLVPRIGRVSFSGQPLHFHLHADKLRSLRMAAIFLQPIGQEQTGCVVGGRGQHVGEEGGVGGVGHGGGVTPFPGRDPPPSSRGRG